MIFAAVSKFDEVKNLVKLCPCKQQKRHLENKEHTKNWFNLIN
jgi:hypothetical protein